MSLGTMRLSIQLLEEIVRDLTAMHLKLIHHRSAGKIAIGGMPIDELIAEIDAGILNRQHMLACFKAEAAARTEPSPEQAVVQDEAKETAPGGA